MGKTWVLKDSDRYYCHHTLRRATKGLPFAEEKNPARAYTLSLLFWGGGQSYLGHRWKALFFRASMVLFFLSLALVFLYGNSLPLILHSYGISRADAFLSAELLFFLLLLFWKYNAGDAYHAAEKARKIPFRGISNRVLPPLCSLLVPGWGQFVNGQPVKGSIFAGFSLLGFFSLVTVPAVLFFWPYFEISQTRFVIEVVFTASALFLPVIPLLWIASGYDALKVSLDDMKKESIVDRILYALSRFRMHGWASLWDGFLRFLAFAAIAVVFAIVMKNSSPVRYAADHVAAIQSGLQQRGITMLPDLLGKIQFQKL